MRPNMLFFFPDQWRGDWWSGAGSSIPVRTPTLQNLADRGTIFDSAITPSPLCAPARACITRGRNYPAVGVVNNSINYPLDVPSVYRSLRDNGYHVAGCGKFDLHKAEYVWGQDGSHLLPEWGFSAGIDNEGKIDGVLAYAKGTPGPYLGFLAEQGKADAHAADFEKRVPHGTFPTPLSEEEYCDNWITGNALDLLSNAPADKPWFLQVNWAGPHDPFDVTSQMRRWYADTLFPEPVNPGPEPIDHLAIRQNYAAMIENIDRGIARVLDHPRVRDEIENTIVIFASDHGEMLGDHGYYGKCTPHNGSLHVPLIIAGPGVQPGHKVAKPVSIVDLPATFLHAADAPGLPDMESQSLLPVANGTGPSEAVVTAALDVPANSAYRWQVAMDAEYKYVQWASGETALFDRSDPREVDNLADDHPDVAKRLGSALDIGE